MNINPKKHRIALFFLIIFVSFVMFTNVAVPKAHAQLTTLDPANLGQNIWKGVKWVYDKFMKQAIAMAFKEGLKMVLSQIAYDAATQIATGGRGQKSSFFNQNWGDYLGGVGDAVLGQMLDDLSKEWGGFDICDPASVNIKLGINLSLFKERKPSEFGLNARCNWSEISSSWDTWAQEVQEDPSKLYGDLKASFKPAENDAGMFLTLQSTLMNKEEEKQLNAIIERSVNKGIKDNVSPIIKNIKTPALMLGEKFASVDKDTGKVEYTYTGEIVDSFLGTFTNTLMAKWMEQLFNEGFDTAQELEAKIGLPGGPGSGFSGPQIARADSFASLAKISFTSSQQNVIDLLVLPSANPLVNSLPGTTDEVITSDFALAVKAKKTLQMAIDDNNINGDWSVGFTSQKNQPSYKEGYPYRSLVILRNHRISPIGWELAAQYYYNWGEKPITFNYLIDCFEDKDFPDNPRYPLRCREDTNGDDLSPDNEDTYDNLGDDYVKDFNPYYHLVDPNWVLKAPETICSKQGPGPELYYDDFSCTEDNIDGTTIATTDNGEPVYATGPNCEAPINPDITVSMVQRNTDYCGDWQSCILEDDDGRCNTYGYCVKEKPIWRFEGDSCPAYYNSCETFFVNGNEFSYLRDTLLSCEQKEVGCTWYSIASVANTTNELVWSPTDRIYLNQNAESCTYSNAGCTNLASLKQGINTVFNGNFNKPSKISANPIPLGWEEKQGLQPICTLTTTETGEVEIYTDNFNGGAHCQLQSEGYIPIDTNFTYQFNYKIRASTDTIMSGVGLTFYDENFVLCDLDHAEPCNTNLGQILFDNVYGLTTDYVYHSYQIGPDSDPLVNFEPGAKYVKAVVKGPHTNGDTGTLWIDEIQLTVIKSPIVKHNNEDYSKEPDKYSTDYSLSSNNATYLKVPPEHFNCESYNNFLYAYTQDTCEDSNTSRIWRTDIGDGVCVEGGSSYCSNYANLCSAEDVGCNGYTPVNGGPEVPARVTEADICPAECSGYDSYLQQITYFDEIEEDPDPEPIYQNFIVQHPATQFCSAQDSGCEQFTNMDEVAKGGEGIEYFSYLRQCISANNPYISAYYTWEGSDTTGYQLKKWTLLGTNYDGANGAPCTNTTLNAEGCQDDADNQHTCTYGEDDLNCRDFFNSTGDHFHIDQQYVITASGQCHPYRRTLTGQTFNADPSEGISCPASSNGCKEYKGNTGNNIREVANLDFENTAGTSGDVIKTNGETSGLALSNEALYQGGHSLRVSIYDDTIVYPLTGELTESKQYQLSFWARKFPLGGAETKIPVGQQAKNFINRLVKLFNQKAIAQNSNNSLEFTQNNLTTEWQLYTLGPKELNVLESQSQLTLTIENLGATEGFYIDNILLLEYAENFYIIEDSWETPISCDQPYVGAELGCLTYLDTDDNKQYLKSFDYICSPTSIGCEAFIDTKNSTDFQAEKIEYGVCDDNLGTVKNDNCSNPFIPDGDNCCLIRGVEMCNIVGDDSSCEYENIVVPNDEMVYVVNDSNKYCAESEKGCTMVGLPELDRQFEIYTGGDTDEYYSNYIKSFSNSYIINNPDMYGAQLCSESGLYCESFEGDPDLTAKDYFFNPVVNTAGGEQTSGKTCFYDEQTGNWKKSGTNEICAQSQFMPTNKDSNYEGWVGLCDADYSTCTEYRDPEQPIFDKVTECDALISPQLSNICNYNNDGESYYKSNIDEKWYCRKEINGVTHNVCQLKKPNPNSDLAPMDCNSGYNQDGAEEHCTPCSYTEHDWICTGESDSNCQLTGAIDKNVCYIQPDADSCKYSLACESYYYLHNTVNTCDGIIDREAGCLLFNDTSNLSVTLSSDATLDYGPSVAPMDCSDNFSGDLDCDSNTSSGIKVRKDRECDEMLYCTSAITIENEQGSSQEICLAIGRCAELDPLNPSNCLKPLNDTATHQTYDFQNDLGPTGVDKIRNYSGFSKAGLIWHDSVVDNDDKIIPGYYAPENMLQTGQKKTVNNGSFDISGATFSDPPKDWTLNAPNQPSGTKANNYLHNICNYGLKTNIVNSGKYSLELTLDSTAINLEPTSCDVSSSDFIIINSGKTYNLSFYAVSSSGGEKTKVGLAWFDSYGNPCDLENDYCDDDSSVAIGLNEGDYFSGELVQPSRERWEQHTVTFGPGESYEIPENAYKAKIFIAGPSTDYAAIPGTPGTIWYDDFSIGSVLQISEDESINKECRLYPEDDSLSCEYFDYQQYNGWYGYCLERDPSNTEACIQWYPVDLIAGESLSSLGNSGIGYTSGSYEGRVPLYYCLQTKGNYNLGKTEAGPGHFTSGYKIQSHISLNTQNSFTDANPDQRCNGAIRDSNVNNNIRACNLWSSTNVSGNAAVPSSLYCTRSGADLTCKLNKHYGEGGNGIAGADICQNVSSGEFLLARVINQCGNSITPAELSFFGTNYRVWPGSCNSDQNASSACRSEVLNQVDNEIVLDDVAGIYIDFVESDDGGDVGGMGFLERKSDSESNTTTFATHFRPNGNTNLPLSEPPGCRDNTNLTAANKFGFYVTFGLVEGAQKITEIKFIGCPGDEGDGGEDNANGQVLNIFYYLKEPCAYVAQAVRGDNKLKEKTWKTRYEYSWNFDQGNEAGYSKNMEFDNYGATAVLEGLPDTWANSTPLEVYKGVGAGVTFDVNSFAGNPVSVPSGADTPDRMCVGGSEAGKINCESSDECSEGVCAGIGRYCYDNGSNITNGIACSERNECSTYGQYSECRLPNNIEADTLQVALDRLLRLYAKVWGVWKWDEADTRYRLCDYFENGTEDCADIEDDDYLDESYNTTAPEITNIKLNGTSEDVIFTPPGGTVNLSFTTDINNDHLPIEMIAIKWNDGKSDTFEGPMNSQPYDNAPHTTFHVYNCQTNPEVTKCEKCWNVTAGERGRGGWVDAVGDRCVYNAPIITVQDHWEFCPKTDLNSSNGWHGEGIPCDVDLDGITSEAKIIIQP